MANSSASAFQYPIGVLSRATRPESDPIAGAAFVSSAQPSGSASAAAST